MQSDDHERARLLIDRDLVEGIMVEDRAWLRSHLAECAECAGHREMTARILAGLKSLSFEAPRRRARWAAWMAAAAALLVAVPVYQHVRRVEAERQDELLLESVGARISQVVPEALEPLRQQEGGRQ